MSLVMSVTLSVCLFTSAGPANAAEGFADTYEEIVQAAAEEDPVRVCTAGREEEVAPVLAGFHEMFPDVEQPVWERCNGIERRERVLTEYAAGQVLTDVFELGADLFPRVLDSGFATTPDWNVFDGTPLEIDDRNMNGPFVAAGSNSPVIGYNTNLVSPEEAPRSFEECANPKWRGQIMVDVRPVSFLPFLEIWGEERLREWARGVAANEPMWTRSSSALRLLSAGDRKIHCGFNSAWFFRATEGGAKNIAYQFSKETPASFTLIKMIPKNTPSPNAALLLSAYLASKPGQLKVANGNPGYSSPFIEGTWKQEATAEAGVEVINVGWEATKTADEATAMIVEEWGFPQPVNQ